MFGGAPRRLTNSIGDADLSRDGQHLAFIRFNDGQLELVAAGRDGSGAQTVTRLEPNFKYLSPRWSPDGKWIGYLRSLNFDDDLFIVSTQGGEPRRVAHDRSMLRGFGIKVISVAGFPLGAMSIDAKQRETEVAIADGAEEIDFVMNIGRLKQGDARYVFGEIGNEVRIAQGKIVKVIIEAALIYESGMDARLDRVIVVDAPLEVRIRRVMERDHCSRDDILRRIAAQMPEALKLRKADFVIVNDRNTVSLDAKVAFIDRILRALPPSELP